MLGSHGTYGQDECLPGLAQVGCRCLAGQVGDECRSSIQRCLYTNNIKGTA